MRRAPVPIALCLLVAVAIVGRLWGRGGAYVGYELVLPARGMHAVATMPVGAVLRGEPFAWAVGSISAPTSLLLAVIPGALTWWIPGRGWAVAWNLLLTAGGCVLLLRTCAWSLQGLAILAALLLASGPFLNTAVFGNPRITGLLPHWLALWIVCRCRGDLRWTLLGGLLLWALIPQLYDSGRAAPVTLLVAAVTIAVPWRTRLAWFTMGSALLFDVAWAHPSQPILWFIAWAQRWAGLIPAEGQFGGSLPGLSVWLTALPQTLLAREQIVPVLGGIALYWLRTDRAFFVGVWLVHAAFAAFQAATPLLTATGYRLLVWECYAMAVVLCVATDLRTRKLLPVLALVLALGAARQFQQLARYLADPPMTRLGQGPTLPLPPVAPGWDMAKYDLVRAVDAMLADVGRGARLWVIDGPQCFHENPGAPLGIPEALYLGLGHERFVEHVAMFSDMGQGHGVPYRALAMLPAFLADDARARVVWVIPCPGTPPELVAQWDAVDRLWGPRLPRGGPAALRFAPEQPETVR